MLATTVALHDVTDVEGFVNATINEFEAGDQPEWAKPTRAEREELVLEGICIMYALARSYEPRRGGHTKDGKFSGYAAFYLPKKLTTAWHRLNENHRYTTDKNGKRHWLYLKPASSLEGLRDTQRFDDLTGGGRFSKGDTLEGGLRPVEQWCPIQAEPAHDDAVAAEAA